MKQAQAPLTDVRVRIVLEKLDAGGAEKQAVVLARYLRDVHGADVRVLGLLGPPGSLVEPLEAHGLRWRACQLRVPGDSIDQAVLVARMVRILRQERAQIVLPFVTLPNLLCGFSWRLAGASVCVWNERVAPEELQPTWKQRLAVRLTPVFISNSGAGASNLVRSYGLPTSRVHVVHNGVALAPPAADRATWRRRLGVSGDTVVACMLANIHRRKDHATLIRAWARATASCVGTPMCLVLAGEVHDTKLRGELEALASTLGVGESVRFIGLTGDVAGLLDAADFSGFASHLEGVPNGILEAMSRSLPVVATDLPGVREAIGDETADFIVPKGDVEGLARRMADLVRDGELRRRVGRLNRARAEAEFSEAAMCERTLEVAMSASAQR